jgi:SAM-dependent methyltransferase
MKNIEQWHPTKFVYRKGKLVASRNAAHLQVSSRLVVDIVAGYYQQYFPVYAKGKLIDLGCGKVPLYEAYKNYIETNLCVDWENSLHKNPFIDQTCDLSERLPFDDNSFDTILLSDVLEHIPEPEKLCNEMARILRPGGSLILNVPFLYKIHEMPFDFYRYTEYALRRFADKSNLQVALLKPMGGIAEVLSDLMGKLCFKIPLLGAPMAIVIQWMCKIFRRASWGKKLSEKTGNQYPLGYFMILIKNSSTADRLKNGK